MKMIERIMVSAIIANQLVEYGNTKVQPLYWVPDIPTWAVEPREADGSLPDCVKDHVNDVIMIVDVKLHDNTIASINKSEMKIYLDCRHQYTQVVRSRLNAILLSLTDGAFTVDQYFDLVQNKASYWTVTLTK